MHRVIAGVNLWAIAFLALALGLGLAKSPLHQPVAVFATVFGMLAQCVIFALFMGASKLLKEHLERFSLPPSLLDRTNEILVPLFRWATAGALAVLTAAMLGGLTASGEVSPWIHPIVGGAVMIFLGIAAWHEVPMLRSMHEILLDMEAALPEPVRGAVSAPPGTSPDLRVRGLVYVGSTGLAMVLGYKYVAGLKIPPGLAGIVIGLSLLCLAVAGALVLSREAPSR